MKDLSTIADLWVADDHGSKSSYSHSPLSADSLLRELPRAALHELFYETIDNFSLPPVIIPSRIALEYVREEIRLAPHATPPAVCWIGRRCWISPARLRELCECLALGEDSFRCDTVIERCLFIDPRGTSELHDAILTTLQSPAVAAVIADCSKYTMAFSRKLSLIAKDRGVMALMLRDVSSLHSPSTATTRWKISASQSSTAPQWRVELLRWKSRSIVTTSTTIREVTDGFSTP